MQCNYKNTDSFKKTIDSLKEIVNEAVIQFTDEKMSIVANDEAKVCCVDLCMKSSLFEKYKIEITDASPKVDIGISLVDMSNVLNLSSGKDILLNLSWVENGPLKIKSGKTKFDLKLKNVDFLEVEFSESPDYVYKIEMDSKELNKIVKNLSSIGDTCKLNVNKDSVEFEVDGDIGNGSVSLSECKIYSFDTEGDEVSNFKYSIKYLLGISKSFILNDKVTLYLNSNALLCVEYKHIEEDKGHLRFYLAPKNVKTEAT